MNVRFAMAAMAALLISACGSSPAQDTSAQPAVAAQEQGLGQPCGNNTCAAGEYCCNESCGICAPKGGSCTQQVCTGELCGSTVCGTGEYCCNASCGICAPEGGVCTQQECLPTAPEPEEAAAAAPAPAPEADLGPKCNTTTCNAGEYCCNESCSICAPIGGGCIQTYCG